MAPQDPNIDGTLTLIRRAKEGEQQALEDLFGRYYEPVRAYVRGRLGRELRLEAESVDLMQETFLGAVEQFDRFEVRNDASLIHWLARIAENRIRSLARKAYAEKRDRRRQQALLQIRDSITSGDLKIDPISPITLPGESAERAELNEKLHEALEELSEEHREVITHRTFGKATWEQVAELMNLGGESTARQLYARAMVELSSKMGES